MDNIFMLLTEINAANMCDDTTGLGKIFSFIGFLVQLIRWGIPVILVILGTIDVGKAVVEQDEKKQKAAYKTFIQRLIAAIIVFLIPSIVSLVLDNFQDKTADNQFAACTKLIFK